MQRSKSAATLLATLAFVLLALPTCARAQQSQSTLRDGQHDFDFEIGTWKTHIRRLQNPMTGSNTWVEYDGTSVVRKIWDGAANLVELEVDGPAGHIEGLSLRLYNPEAHQWSLNFANSKIGTFTVPTIGEFKNGRGEFYDWEPINGRSVLVRNVFTDVTPEAFHFEQAFSDDGGKTWETNWITDDTRISAEPAIDDATEAKFQAGADAPKQAAGDSSADHDGQHDFDFEQGSWNIHLKQLQHPLTGSHEWVEFDGTSVTRKVWGGRAEIEEFIGISPTSHTRIDGLTLRMYDPKAHQWSLYWANKRTGVVAIPTVGEFKNGVGKFYDHESLYGKMTLVRYVWSKTDSAAPHFEQAFSLDGGETWEVNWITDQTRTK
jgi:hypothetical protein